MDNPKYARQSAIAKTDSYFCALCASTVPPQALESHFKKSHLTPLGDVAIDVCPKSCCTVCSRFIGNVTMENGHPEYMPPTETALAAHLSSKSHAEIARRFGVREFGTPYLFCEDHHALFTEESNHVKTNPDCALHRIKHITGDVEAAEDDMRSKMTTAGGMLHKRALTKGNQVQFAKGVCKTGDHDRRRLGHLIASKGGLPKTTDLGTFVLMGSLCNRCVANQIGEPNTNLDSVCSGIVSMRSTVNECAQHAKEVKLFGNTVTKHTTATKFIIKIETLRQIMTADGQLDGVVPTPDEEVAAGRIE